MEKASVNSSSRSPHWDSPLSRVPVSLGLTLNATCDHSGPQPIPTTRPSKVLVTMWMSRSLLVQTAGALPAPPRLCPRGACVLLLLSPCRSGATNFHYGVEPIQCDIEAHCLCYDVISSSNIFSSEAAGKYPYIRRAVVSAPGRACLLVVFVQARRRRRRTQESHLSARYRFLWRRRNGGTYRYAQGTSARDKVASIYPPALFSDIGKSPTVTTAPFRS